MLLVLGLLPATAGAASFSVASPADVAAMNPASGCATPSGSAAHGACTLRSSVQAASASAGASTVTLPAGTYDLTIPQQTPRVDDGSVGNLVVSSGGGATDVTITGAGFATTIIDGGGQNGTLQDRLLHVLGSVSVHVAGLTFRNGYMVNNNGSSDTGDGGGIEVVKGASATIDNSLITDNISQATSGGDGGGVAEGAQTNDAARAPRAGRAPATPPSITITNSTISSNTAANEGGGVFSGGGEPVNLLRDTIIANGSNSEGGGFQERGGATDTLTNDTITDNVAGGSTSGGGVNVTNGSVNLTNDTINANTVQTGSGGNLGSPGEGASIQLKSTIVVGGTGDGGPSNCFGSTTSSGHNLFDDSGGDCGAVAADVTNANPKLGPPQDNGGPTPTEALQTGSPAIDGVPLAACTDFAGNPVSTDQRGVPRPQPVGGSCDIGAYEVSGADMSLTGTVAPNPGTVGQPETFTFTVNNAGPTSATNVMFTDSQPSNVTVNSVTPSQGSCSGTTTITCNLGSVPDGQATVTIVVTPHSAGTLTTPASVSAAEPDPNPTNNSVTLSVPIVAPAQQQVAGVVQTKPQVTSPPPTVVCASLRHFDIHIQHVSQLGLVKATVFVNGHKVRVLTGGSLHSLVDLRRLPRGTFTVKITGVTRSGRKLHAKRTYHTCHHRLPGHKFLLL